MSNNKKQNNYAFIDSQNLNLSVRECGWELDFGKFYVYLKYKYKISKAYLFMGYIAANEPLYSCLISAGYEIIFKPVLKNGEVIKGNVDAELVLHTMLQYKNFDKAVIVTGDGDFYCLVEQLIKDGKLLKIGIPNKKRYSALLRKFSQHLFYINLLQNKLSK